MLELKAMTAQDYEFWSLRSRMSYAQSKIKANGLTREEAVKVANADFERLLPEGLATKENFFFSAFDGETRVGFVWFQTRGAKDNRRAYICDIIVEPDLRGKGFGKQMMVAVEADASAMGLKRIGLHVFGYNDAAIALYKSLGYFTTDLNMEKPLS
ncbi:MAG: GNAT family N-acetyltransferase [Bdellovibrionota bacterium]